jgi:hypothetical protein
VWTPTPDQRFQCQICPGHEPVQSWHILGHEDTKRHKRNLLQADIQHKQNSQSSGFVSGSNSARRVPVENVSGALSRTLAQIAQPSSRVMLQTSLDEETGGVDWNSDLLHSNTQMQPAPEVQATRQLAKNLQAYLKEKGALDLDSDDDPQERSENSESDSSDSEGEKNHITTNSFSNINSTLCYNC